MNIKVEKFKDCLGLFSTGISIITTANPKKSGITINSFSSVSLEPFSVLFCLYAGTSVHKEFVQNDHFAVNILSESQKDLSNLFAHPSGVDWDKVEHSVSPKVNCPILSGSLAYLECKKENMFDGGTHSIILGKVINLRILSEEKPLVYFGRHYHEIGKEIKK